MIRRPAPFVPLAWGEVIDKATILELKLARISDPAGRANVGRELRALAPHLAAVQAPSGLGALRFQLKAINAELWEIEDAIRAEEAEGHFGARFIALARAVYHTNDRRAALKRRINRLLGSALCEEKSYAAWTASVRSPASSSAARTAALCRASTEERAR